MIMRTYAHGDTHVPSIKGLNNQCKDFPVTIPPLRTPETFSIQILYSTMGFCPPNRDGRYDT